MTPSTSGDPRRPPDLGMLTPGELQRARRDLAAALGLARPGAPARAPIQTHLAPDQTPTMWLPVRPAYRMPTRRSTAIAGVPVSSWAACTRDWPGRQDGWPDG